MLLKCERSINWLLERGYPVDAKDPLRKRTLAWEAASEGHRDLLQKLLEHKANVNHKTEYSSRPWEPGTSVYKIARIKEHEEVLKLLSAHAESNGNTIDYVCKDFDARLYKPQRLVSLSYEEEEKRALEGWWWFDWMLNLACFRQRVWKQTCSIFF